MFTTNELFLTHASISYTKSPAHPADSDTDSMRDAQFVAQSNCTSHRHNHKPNFR